MEDDERQQKVLAGKEKLAEFLQKKNRQENKRKRKKNVELEVSDAVVHGDSDTSELLELTMNEKSDDALPVPCLADEDASVNTDCKATLEDYSKKLLEYKDALQQRDELISQLSERLAVTLASRNQVQSEATTQADSLEKEISTLKLQLQQASDILGKQKSLNGISAAELFEAQNQSIWLRQESERKDSVIKDLCSKLNDANKELDKLQLEFKLEVSECEQRLISLESELRKEAVVSKGDSEIQLDGTKSEFSSAKKGDVTMHSIDVQTEREYFVVDIFSLQLDVERMKRTLHCLKDINYHSNKSNVPNVQATESSISHHDLENKICDIKDSLKTYSTEMCLPHWNCEQDKEAVNEFIKSVELQLSVITETCVVLLASDNESSKLKAENEDLCSAMNHLNELVDTLTTEKMQMQEEQFLLRNLTSSPLEEFDSDSQNIKLRTEINRLMEKLENSKINERGSSSIESLIKEKTILHEELEGLKSLQTEINDLKGNLALANSAMGDVRLGVERLVDVEQELDQSKSELQKTKIICDNIEKEILAVNQEKDGLILVYEAKLESCNDLINQLKSEKESSTCQNNTDGDLIAQEMDFMKAQNAQVEERLGNLQEEKNTALKDLEFQIKEKHEFEIQEKVLALNKRLEEEQASYEIKINEAKAQFENILSEMKLRYTQLENEKKCLETTNAALHSSEYVDRDTLWNEKYQALMEQKLQMEMELNAYQMNSVSRSAFEDLQQQVRNLQNMEGKVRLIEQEKDMLFESKVTLQQEFEKLRSKYSLLEISKYQMEQELLTKLDELSRTHVDIEARLEETRVDLELTKSKKIKLEEELRLLKQSDVTNDTSEQLLSFNEQSLHNMQAIVLKDKLYLETEERNKLQKQLAYFAKKSELGERFQSDLVKQLETMREQLKTVLLEQQGLCRDFIELADKKQQLLLELKQVKKALEERVSEEEAKHITICKATVLGNSEDGELVDIGSGNSFKGHSPTWEVSEELDLVVDRYSEEERISLDMSAFSEHEALVSDQKMVMLLENSQQLMREKEELESHVLQLEKLITDMGQFFDQQLQNLTENAAKDWMTQLKHHRDCLLEELHRFHNASLSLSGWLTNNSLLEESLKHQKEFILEKVHEKEALEGDIVHLRKVVERCEQVMKQLEEKLAQRHAVEQELSSHNQILEGELREIELKLREKEESLVAQKIHLQSELKWKDLELKAKELNLQQKMMELENREQQLAMDREDSHLQMNKQLKEEEWQQIRELRLSMEQYHNGVVAGQRLQLEREHAATVMKMEEVHAVKCALLQSQINDLTEEIAKHSNVLCEEESYNNKFDNEWAMKVDCLRKMHSQEMEKTRLECKVSQLKSLIAQRLEIEKQVREEIGFEMQSLKAENDILLKEMQTRSLDNENTENLLKQLSMHLDTKFSSHIQGFSKIWQEIYVNSLSDLHTQLTACFQEVSADFLSPVLPSLEQEAEDLIKRREILLGEASVLKDYVLCHYKELTALRKKLENDIRNVFEMLRSNVQSREEIFVNRQVQTLDIVDEEETLRKSEFVRENNTEQAKDREYKALIDALIKEKDFRHAQEIEKLNAERTDALNNLERHHRDELETLRIKNEEEKAKNDAVLLNEMSARGEELKAKCVEEVDQTWLLKIEEMNAEHAEIINALKEEFQNEKNSLCSENVERVKELISKHNKEMENLRIEFDRERENNKMDWTKREKELETQYLGSESSRKAVLIAGEKCAEELQEQISELMKDHEQEIDAYKKHIQELIEKTTLLEKNLADFSKLESKLDQLQEHNLFLVEEVERLKREKEETEFGLQQQIYDLIEDHSKEVKYEKEKANILLKQVENQKEEVMKDLETKHHEEVDILKKELDNLRSLQGVVKEHEDSDKLMNCNSNVSFRELEELREKLETNFQEERAQMSLAHERELDELTAKYEKEQEILRLSVSELQRELQKIAEAALETVPTNATSFDDVFDNMFYQIEQLTSENSATDPHNVQHAVNDRMYRMKEVLKMEVEKYVSTQLLLQSDCNDSAYEEQRYDTFYRDLQPIQELDEFEYGMDEVEPQFVEVSKNQISVGTDTNDLQLEEEMAEVELLKDIIRQNIASQDNESARVAQEIGILKEQICKVEERNLSLQADLAKAKEEHSVQTKQPKGGREWLADTELSSIDMHTWQVHAAQSNTRLMHVLSDLVKTFVDTEQSIQQRLFNLGLQMSDGGLLEDDDNGPPSGHFHGSREDFATFGQGDGPSLELCDDDLTPRAWDRFAAAIGSQDLETEGEDVLLGASRRLRSTVDHVLSVLSELVESKQSHYLGEQVKRNDELMQNAKDDAHAKEYLQMELLRAGGAVKAIENEKQLLEEKVFLLQEKINQQSRDLASVQKQIGQFEEQNDSLSGENSLLEQQNVVLSSGLQEPEIKELLEEQTRVLREKQSQKQQGERERQRLLCRIHQLEVSVEELSSQKDEIFEEKTREITDLKTQMEAMEKQLLSNRKFIDEQAHEREQEREDFTREIAKLQSSMKDKERNHVSEKQLAKEIESLEQQLKSQTAVLRDNITRREQLETELKNSMDKIIDKQDVISELESQLDRKTKTEQLLKQQIETLTGALSQHEKARGELNQELDEVKQGTDGQELAERVRLLESQLDVRDQKLEQLTGCQNLLQEFRGQIHVLDEKIETKMRQLGRLKIRTVTSSPVSSEDASTSDSKEHEIHLMIQEGRVLSPSSLHWEEIKHFESKIDLLLTMCDDLHRRYVDAEIQLRRAKSYEEELCREKDVLQQQLGEHLLQISTLRTHIEDKRYDTRRSKVASSVIDELNHLKERVLREQAHREKAERLVKDSSEKFSEMQEHFFQEKQKNFDLEVKMSDTHQECLHLREERDSLKALAAAGAIQEMKDSAVKHAVSVQVGPLSICQEDKHKDLETELQEMKNKFSSEREANARQVCTLLKEIESLNKYQEGKEAESSHQDHNSEIRKNLQDDFDALQEMYQQKVDELLGIQKEVDNQLELESTVESLKTVLLEERKKSSVHVAEVAELQERVKQLSQQNQTLQENVRMKDEQNEDNEALKLKIRDLICDETQKQVSKEEEKHKHELDATVASLLEKHEKELEQIQDSLNAAEERVRKHWGESIELKAENEHLKRLCALEAEAKSKLEKLLADYKQKLKQMTQESNRKLDELQKSLVERHQEEMNHIREHAEAELAAGKRNWEEERRCMETAFDGEKRELSRRHEAQLLDLEARHKSECHTMTTLHEAHLKQLEEEKEALMKKNNIKELEANYQDKIKHIWDMLHRSKAQSLLLSRESTPDSDATSSSLATSTGDEHDGLPKRMQKLFDKVFKEGIEVLTLTECQQLRDHLTPEREGQGDVDLQNMDVWRMEKELILHQVKTLSSLFFPGQLMDVEKLLKDIYSIFQKSKDRISLELNMFADHPFSPFNLESLDEKVQHMESQMKIFGTLLNESVASSKSVLSKELLKNHQLEQQVLVLKEQVAKDSWQIRTQKEMLEFRLKQEKNQIGELQTALNSEKVHNLQLESQLQQQRNLCTDLQMALSTAKAEISHLQHHCSQVKKEADNNKNFYDMEKTHKLSLMKALEMERSNFNQVQMTLQSERFQNKSLHSQSQQVIKELRATVVNSPPELLRAEGDHGSRSFDHFIPSLSLNENMSAISECPKCGTLKATLDTERIAWANQESALTKSLKSYEEQLKKVLKASSSRGELEQSESVVGRNKILSLYYKYRRSEHHRLALINQKHYLAKLLEGFEMTESAALRMLSSMGVCSPQGSVCNYTADGSKCNRFRVAVYTVMAILRLRFLVRRTKKTFSFVDSIVNNESRLPSTHHFSSWLTANKNGVSPSLSSNSSLSSAGTSSLPGFITQSHTRPTSSRHHRKSSPSLPGASFQRSTKGEGAVTSQLSTQKSSKLTDCVTRLSHLHKTLGLDDSTE